MDMAQIFKTGRSQAVRLPKEFRFNESEVTVQHFGGGVLLLPKNGLYAAILTSLANFEPDLQLIREQPAQQERVDIAP
ncbi:MAG: type II toxin-antitoxin system VapB family antitoxin [Polynucleobacter sp.]|uniref:antitoxin n=1 Tax=Polynucleobacter sp. TaxID=2029855 RepID=UPI00271DFC84|nr:type II toxin-antitoxin system VapB family antitoxin [Polynucleobacter sp.]MDO8715017.1 type II toxin-antitoxin system VapB family antitoxin [Polynucleobacter sp.]